MNDSITSINNWQALARPTPSQADMTIAFAVMLEEFVELMDSMYLSRRSNYARQAVHEWSEALKKQEDSALIKDRKELCDAIADVIVTAVGVGHCAGMDIPTALERVDTSNWSKCIDGQFIRNDQGKIIKPESYVKPNLDGCY